MQLTPGASIGQNDPVNRQTLFDVWNLAVGSTIDEDDLDTSTIRPAVTQTDPPTPAAGRLWFDKYDQVMKVFIDELDGTGISLWTAFGPDRYEIAVLATEPIPFGAAVMFTGDGRKVKLPPDVTTLNGYNQAQLDDAYARIIGFNNQTPTPSHNTAASGTWFACAIEGFCHIWYPANKNTGAQWLASSAGYDGLIEDITGATCLNAAICTPSLLRGGLIWQNNSGPQKGNPTYLAKSTHYVDALNTQWGRNLWLGARMNQKN